MDNLMAFAKQMQNGGHSTTPSTLAETSMTLLEAAMMLPIVVNESIAESHLAHYELKDSAIATIMTESSADPDVLMEGIFGTIKDKLVAGLEKIKEFIMNIISKLKQFYDTTFKSGSMLVSKYESKIGNDFSKLEYKGYVYKSFDLGLKAGAVETFIDGTLGIKKPLEFSSSINSEDEAALKETRKTVLNEKVKGDRDEAKLKFFNATVGESAPTVGDFATTLHQKFRESKEPQDLKNPSKATVCKIINDGKDTTTLVKDYEDLKKTCDDLIKKVNNSEKTFKEAESNGGASVEGQRATLAKDYLVAYVELAKEILGVATTINSARVAAFEERYKANVALFKKMINYKEKKTDNNSFDMDEFEVVVEE